ncbi:putative protease YoaZ [Deinococcus piscis]|uniref:Protease YoaZ n=1 Tax=Deinococcus piscis TaxID=394230 RepID=A0ABQ3K8V2_9DEIO|nr:type 1 glutamine amidotransferase family protein [Deinococcus piscis]GHG07288.1 putative protease YoaZ [Deinococcus piscis]
MTQIAETKMKPVHLYIQNTFADWEPGYLLAELRTGRYLKGHQQFDVQAVSVSGEAVESMGGLRVSADLSVQQLRPENSSLLILPGADTWAEERHSAILDLTAEFLAAGVPVAAICGATIALAEARFLDNCPHTSNDLGALKYLAPHYQGERHYQAQPAVQSGKLVTASGTAPVHFAAATMQMMDVMTPEVGEAWLTLHTRQDPEAYARLMELTQ